MARTEISDVIVDASDVNKTSLRNWLAGQETISPLNWGAAGDGTTDDATNLQQCIDDANSTYDYVVVDLLGRTYAVTDTIYVKNNVVLANGVIRYTGASTNKAIVQMGSDDSSGTLIRRAGIDNVRAYTTVTVDGIVGFRIGNYVRSSFIRDCFAEMNGDTAQTRTHIGFQILANRLALGANAGTYQNRIEGCTALFATDGLSFDTQGTDAEALADPQANGNYVNDFFAFSCRRRALYIGHGAQENVVRGLRADTFPDETGLGTTISVVEIDGRYNSVDVHEEIGNRADTQYTVKAGSDSLYNDVVYSTQQVVTAKVSDGGGKNTFRQVGSAKLKSHAGKGFMVDYYTETVVSTSVTQEVRYKWVAPWPCIVVQCAAVLNSNTTTTFDAYFAKNSTYSTSNRIQFTSGEGTTAEYLDNDPTAGTAINSRWILAKGDFLTFAVTNGSGETNRVAMTAIVVPTE